MKYKTILFDLDGMKPAIRRILTYRRIPTGQRMTAYRKILTPLKTFADRRSPGSRSGSSRRRSTAG